MKLFKLFIKSKNGDKFVYLTTFNDLEYATAIDLLNCMYCGSKVLIEVMSQK